MTGIHDRPNKFKVGLVQMAMSDDPSRNLRAAVARVTEAAKGGAAIVCLPELFRSRYFAQREDPALFDLAEPIPGPSTERLGWRACGASSDCRSARANASADRCRASGFFLSPRITTCSSRGGTPFR